MNRRVLGLVAATAALLVITPDASAFGKRKRGGSAAPSCEPACAADCGPVAPAAPACAPAVSYVSQTVTCYKTEWKTKEVQVQVMQPQWVDQKVTTTVCRPVTTTEKVKVCKMVQSTVPYTYTAYEMQAVPSKVKVCQMNWTEQDQPYTYCEPVWGTTKVMRTVCETVCVPTQVVSAPVAPAAPACDTDCGSGGGRRGLFSRLCHKKQSCNDECAPPSPAPVACAAPVVHTVMVPQVVTKQVEAEVQTCTMVQKQGTRKVRVCTPTWVEQDVTTYQCVPVQKQGQRVVCTPTWVEQDVPVTRMVATPVEQTVRVCQMVPSTQTMTVSYCERVPYQTTIQVPVAAPDCGGCAAPAPACCH